MTHIPVVVLSKTQSRGAYGLIATRTPSTLVIFVHGFLGDPRSTWTDFEHLTQRDPSWNDTDLYFYGYRSRNQVPSIAADFDDFLLNVLGGPQHVLAGAQVPSGDNSLFRSPLLSRKNEPYTELILVGHSTGALVIRETIRHTMASIIELSDESEESPNMDVYQKMLLNSKLRFFAPAHVGVMSAGKLGVLRSLPIISRFTSAYFLSNPLYQNLKPESYTIKNLKDETEKLWEKYKFPGFRAISMFGKDEEIVCTGKYSHDYESLIEDGHHHTSICKPYAKFLKPLEFVKHGKPVKRSANI